MSTSDALDAVARDLALLNRSDRRAILQSLDLADRSRIRTAMRGHAPALSGSSRAGESGHSPQFEALIAAAHASDAALTAAVRSALLDAAARSRSAATPLNGRSLLQAAGGLLGQKMAR